MGEGGGGLHTPYACAGISASFIRGVQERRPLCARTFFWETKQPRRRERKQPRRSERERTE
jgi:hypothetical protein